MRPNLRPFTPSREDPDALVGRTVGRDLLLDSIERRLLTAATTKNRCHTLVVGPRGSGKTHVLDVALHRLRNDRRQNEGLVVARLDEDVVGIVTYADLVVHIAEALGLPTDTARRTRASRDVVAMEAAITAHQRGRALIVVVENLSRVFESFGTTGQQDFRSFVETSGNVMLLASAPLLFEGVMSRRQPWFGSFAIEHLSELTLDEGTELLRRLAVEDGDEAFARYIQEPRGQGRLAALHHLAGGSPRLWMVLAGCASVELLDDLVPAVEELLEKLVAYYQQRLWELPGNEQKLVRELGTGPPSASVADLAAACGLEERTAATALGRLAEAGWVRSEKLPGTDQRKSWYRLREPLLRHHFQYRQADGAPLRLIVDILRLWFDPTERRLHLGAVRPRSQAERHLLATLSLDPPQRSDSAYADRDVDRLLGEVRSWISDPDSIGSPTAGMLLEAGIVALKTSAGDGRRVLDQRRAPASVRGAAEQLFARLAGSPTADRIADRAGVLLDAAADASTVTPDYPVLALVATSWNGASDPERAASRLAPLLDSERTDRLMLALRHDYGHWLKKAGSPAEAMATLLDLIEDQVRVLSADHPDTLMSRSTLACWLGEVGRIEEAITGSLGLVEDYVRVLGGHHPDTLTSRNNLACLLGEAGRVEEAISRLSGVVEGRVRRLGDDHPATLASRHSLSYWLAEAGRTEEAIACSLEVVQASLRVLGGDDSRTLTYQHNLACWLGEAGRVEEAIAGLSRVVDEMGRVLGGDHPDTLVSRSSFAFWSGKAGRVVEAIALFSTVVADMVQVLGSTNKYTRMTERNQIRLLVRVDRLDEAAELAVAMVNGLAASLGDEDVAAREAAAALLEVLVDSLRRGMPIPNVGPATSRLAEQILALVGDMEAARDGSAEAGARLPAALRSLVEGL